MRRRFAFTVLVIVALTAAAAADTRAHSVLQGGCYCRAAGELKCLGFIGESACRTLCDEQLCDDWFWLERRECWTWGYGG